MTWTILSLLAFVLSWGGIWLLLRHLAERFMDRPNQRSSHISPTPRGGGISFVAAFLVVVLIADHLVPTEQGGGWGPSSRIVVVLLPLWIVGILDDFREISAGVRFLVQLAAAGLAVHWFGPLPGIERIFEGFAFPWLPFLVGVVAVTALINFYNFMDGLDGIVGGTSAVQFAFFAWYLHQPLWWILVAALLGFLLWNWPPAKVFMGDSGSTVLGGAVALALLQAPTSRTMWWAAAVTAPLVGDAAFTLLRRLARRENVLEPHKSHIYQRLHQSGWSHRRVTCTYMLLTVVIAALVVALT
ncbi:MAG: glycosyltransferase family 4 protein [Polyangiales bacterium]